MIQSARETICIATIAGGIEKMSLLEKILRTKPPCKDCVHLIWPRKDLPFCKVKDKIILPDFPPTKCEQREVEANDKYL